MMTTKRPDLLLLDALYDAELEAKTSMDMWAPCNSAHEGYAVLLEEVDELWAHIKVKQGKRDVKAMRKEAVQVAAMALRFVVEVCDIQEGKK